MPKKAKTNDIVKTDRIEIRIDADLKAALNTYGDSNLQTVAEAVTNAIKEFIGFKQKTKPARHIANDATTENKKNERLEIRIYPQLKQELLTFCKENKIDNVTLAITTAIKGYIGYTGT